MAEKQQVTKPETISDEVTDSVNEITLDEFCARLSVGDRRFELIAAFHFDERTNGKAKDFETAYRARFEAFATKPV